MYNEHLSCWFSLCKTFVEYGYLLTILFVKEGVLYAGSGTLNTQSLHEEGAREAVFC